MNKQESLDLMIGSWVLVNGEPRQVCKLTNKKAGFKRSESGHRDFYRFDQIQGFPLSVDLFKHCVTYKSSDPREHGHFVESINYYGEAGICIQHSTGSMIHQVRYLHEVQSILYYMFRTQIDFDVEKYKWAKQPEMVVTKTQMEQLKKMATAPIGKDTPKVVLKESLSERLKEFGKRVSSVYKQTPLLPSPEKGENGLQEGMLTYKDAEKENPNKLFEPGTLITIRGTSCVFMSVGVKTNNEIDTFNGFDILTGEPVTRCDGQARLATKKECTLYWSALRRKLSNQKPY